GALLRFKHEFRTVQDVAHPNLVRLGELIEEAGHWFFTMELVEGTDLLSYVRLAEDEPDDSDVIGAMATVTGGVRHGSTSETAALPDVCGPDRDSEPGSRPWRFSEERLRDAFAQLASGLDGLHRSRLVHRDVKPSNVLVMPSGRVVILDFGIASEVASVAD